MNQIIETSNFVFETYCSGGPADSEAAEAAREHLEAICAMAMAEDRMKRQEVAFEAERSAQEVEEAMWASLDAALEQEIEEAVMSEMFKVEEHHTNNASLIDMASWPDKRDRSRAKSLGGVCLTTQSARRQGRAGVNKNRSLKEAGRRLARIFRTEREAEQELQVKAEWEDMFKPADLDLLLHGYESCGPCYLDLDPHIYLELWASQLRPR